MIKWKDGASGSTYCCIGKDGPLLYLIPIERGETVTYAVECMAFGLEEEIGYGHRDNTVGYDWQLEAEKALLRHLAKAAALIKELTK